MRRAIMISLTTMVPPWFLKMAFLEHFIFRTRHTFWPSFLPSVPDIVYLVPASLLALLVVLVLSRFGFARAEYWWLAGGLFVVAAAANSLILGIRGDSDAVYLDLLFSAVFGYWLAIFVIGALAWRHWTPTYRPRSWTSAPVIADIYALDDEDE